MKKGLKRILLVSAIVSSLALVGCAGDKNDSATDSQKDEKRIALKVGASPEPHSKMLELVKDDLKNEGIDMEIVEFSDYVQPNLTLDDGTLDANFFQHLPYLESFNEENKTDLVSLGSIHIEPMGVYSEKIKSIDELKSGSRVSIPNDATNGARALLLLEKNGLIKLDEKAGFNATEKDIVENPKDLKFEALEAATLPRTVSDVDIAIINGNYAIQGGFDPIGDSILLEENSSPYGNIIAIRKGDENRPELKALMKALQSDKIKKYIEEEFKGSVIPGF